MKENKDNWLEEELKREKSISVWDLDEASKIRAEHKENCEREKIADEHKEIHLLSEESLVKLEQAKQMEMILPFMPIVFLVLFFLIYIFLNN